ncbi:hypothetical protein HOLleu_33245 [Holothuria leucospilota]|uniref:Uncharacterized protein n=1 Tax=Holothuria leucospilota TaxID=206669 RepID=A0A9Q0YNA9_HOLLE|nr:hypothetical protein HOLleu_33245 [Holothuria leucospilota]
MEHTKKLVLVSPEVLERVKGGRSQTLEKTKVQELEEQLSSVLSDPRLDDATKMKRYSEVLQRYTVYHAKANEPLKVRVLPETSSSVQPGDNLQKRVIEQDVIESVPRAYKSKATQLLGKIASNDSGLDWTDRGELVVNDHTIKGSHIVDLVNDMMRKRKSATPIGMDEFTKALARINTPRELVDNPDRWQDLSRWRDLGDAPRKVRERPLSEEVPEDNDGDHQTCYAKANHLPVKKRPDLSPRKSRKIMRAWEKY